MKKGQVYEATVERVDFPNKGIAQTGEGAVTVKNSLPGQKIRLGISKVRNGKAEGRLLEVLEKSPLETESPCSHFGVCGGCTYLSLPYEEQLRVKGEQVKRLLDACLEGQEENWNWEGIKGSPKVYGYRNKMEFTFGDEVKDGPLTLGMHRRGSFYDVVTVEGCRIADADYRLILKTVLSYFTSENVGSGIRYYHRMRHEGYLRHLVVRKASYTGEILTALVTSSQNPWEGPAGMTEAALVEGFRDSLLELERSGRLQGRFAGILHKEEDASHYDRLARQVKGYWNSTFVDPATKKTRTTDGALCDTQCSYVLGLEYGVAAEEIREDFGRHLVRKARALDYTVGTGFFGTGLLNQALTDTGHTEEGYKNLLQTACPSWLYPVTQGATTIWERWDSYTEEKGFGGQNAMNSFNHYSLGSVLSWMYHVALGIRKDEGCPGGQRFILKPEIGPLVFAKGSVSSPYGVIRAGWERSGEQVTYRFEIPVNTRACLVLPEREEQEYGSGCYEVTYRI